MSVCHAGRPVQEVDSKTTCQGGTGHVVPPRGERSWQLPPRQGGGRKRALTLPQHPYQEADSGALPWLHCIYCWESFLLPQLSHQGGGRICCAPCRTEGHGHCLCRPVKEVDDCRPLCRVNCPIWEVDIEAAHGGRTAHHATLRGTAEVSAAPSRRWTAVYPSVASLTLSGRLTARLRTKAGL